MQNEYIIKGNRTYWLCKCDCGNEKYIYRNNLTGEKTKSCGCVNTTINGLSNSRLYKTWWSIKERCYKENHYAYKDYGGRGIKLCDEWLDFLTFYEWAINNGYNDDLTIERIDNDKGYSPENCTWITKSENTANANRHNHRRKTKFIYYGISPEGNYYEFKNANKFSQQFNLHAGLVREIANGHKYKTKDYKGWKFGFTDKLNI